EGRGKGKGRREKGGEEGKREGEKRRGEEKGRKEGERGGGGKKEKFCVWDSEFFTWSGSIVDMGNPSACERESEVLRRGEGRGPRCATD
ncbi:hypothetical protein ACC841_36245, partial [Rhizobium ruizarguesonis]